MKERYRLFIIGSSIGIVIILIVVALNFIYLSEINLFKILKSPLFYLSILIGVFITGLGGFLVGTVIDKKILELINVEKEKVYIEQTKTEQIKALNFEMEQIMADVAFYTNQLESIMDNIISGICVINREYKIEMGFNKEFINIFGDKDYVDKSILDTVFQALAGTTKSELKDFFELCFTNTTASANIIDAANPIDELKYLYHSEGEVIEKIIKIKITRIKDNEGTISKLLFVFTDITFEKEIELELKEKEKEYQDEMEIITVIFKNDKDIIISFINDINERMEQTKKIFEHIEQETINKEFIQNMIRNVHTVKGESFSIGFNEFATIARDFEDTLKAMLDREITLEDNMQIMNYLELFDQQITKLNSIATKLFKFSEDTGRVLNNAINIDKAGFKMFEKFFQNIVEDFKAKRLTLEQLLEFQINMKKLTWNSLDILEKELKLVNEKTALNEHKTTTLNFIYDIDSLPVDKFKFLKETLLHLIRNSIGHGIEIPEQRQRLGKPLTGKINIHIYQENNNCIVLYSDDGAGFNLEEIKTKSLEKGLVTEKELANMDEKHILQLIFKDGLSTAKQKNQVSGTGVGMSVVKNNIKNFLKGKLSIKNNPLKGIQLIISFPIED